MCSNYLNSFTANTGYSFGILPTNSRPTYANKTQTVDSRLHIDITASDDVSIKSWTNVSSVGSQINFSQVFAKTNKKTNKSDIYTTNCCCNII